MVGPRVAAIGEVWRVDRPTYFTLVGYRGDVTSHRWEAIQTDAQGRYARGSVLNLDSSDFIVPTGYESVIPGRIMRKNAKEIDRSCPCQCCWHMNWEPGDE